MFQRFMKMKYRVKKPTGGYKFRGLDAKVMALSNTQAYDYKVRPLRLAILDVRDMDRLAVPENTSNLTPFLEYLSTKLELAAKEASV